MRYYNIMTALEWMQATGGAAFLIFGLNTMARQIGSVVEPFVSALTERWGHQPYCPFFSGIIAGLSFHGRRCLSYVRRRRLAGLLSLPQTIGMMLGMAVGMMLPALAIHLLPDEGRYIVLIIGFLLSLSFRSERLRCTGHGLIGLGCGWFGLAALKAVLPAGIELPVTTGGLLFPLAFYFQCPTAFWLLFTTVNATGSLTAILWAMIPALLGWGLALIHRCTRLPNHFSPAISLLDAREERFPERALQAVLQEIQRFATGLSQTTNVWLPSCFEHAPINRSAIQDVEDALNEFKPAAQRQLRLLSRRTLDHRQAQILLHLYRCVSDLERIGDHLHRLAKHAATAGQGEEIQLPDHLQATSRLAATTVANLLATVAASITGRHERAEQAARQVLQSRDQTIRAVNAAKTALTSLTASNRVSPEMTLRFRNGFMHLERLTRHVRAIALVEMQPEFWLNPDEMHHRAPITHPLVPPPVPIGPYLRKLEAEEADR